MSPWLLLVLTVVCAALTYDAFCMRSAVRKSPFSVISHLWGKSADHLSLTEKEKIKDRFLMHGSGTFDLGPLFFLFTVVLAVATVKAFIQ